MRWIVILAAMIVSSGKVLADLESENGTEATQNETSFNDATATARAARFPCQADSRHSDFDFWVGEWDVYQNETLAGENRISSILGGCLVFEQWQSASGSEGKSFNYFDPGKKHWRQIWVADTGTIIEFTGEARDGGMFYVAETTDPVTGAVTHHRFEFTKLPGDEVRQFWATSTDKKEWITVWDGRYKRKSQ